LLALILSEKQNWRFDPSPTTQPPKKMTVETAKKKNPKATRRFVATSVISEKTLPYNLQALDTPEKANDFWNQFVASEPDFEPDKETLICVVLSTRLVPYAWNRISIGTVNETSAHPREILRPVIASAGSGFILMHNHPSGDPSPSRADEQITRRITEAAALMQIRFLDHVIIGKPSVGRSPYYSFREAGIIS
jgi:DNA repair protein RadC